MKPVSEEAILERLAALGDSPDDIARSLEARGITGVPEDPECCVLANYLKAEFEAPYAYVGGCVRVWETEVTLPGKCEKFIDEFDTEEYPKLLDPKWLAEMEAQDDEDEWYESLPDDDDDEKEAP